MMIVAPHLLVSEALSQIQELLLKFTQTNDFDLGLRLAFGNGIVAEAVQDLADRWASSDELILPPIEIRSGVELGGALGAYSIATNQIFLSSELLEQGNRDQIVAVLLEEFGHSLDPILHPGTDSAGDEGAIFSAVVRGESLTDAQLAALRSEQDQRTIVLDGQMLEVEAASLVVTTLVDENDGGDGGTGLSLREALATAMADDTIIFDASLISGTIALTSGELAIAQSITINGDIDGDGTGDIVIDAQGNSRVLNIDDDTSTLQSVFLQGLTITGGDLANTAENNGGGIVTTENLTLINSLVSGNLANELGGGIFNSEDQGGQAPSLVLTNTTVSNNSAIAAGGGIFNVGSATLTNSNVSNNSANGGGGIFNSEGATLVLTNSTAGDNSALTGGGILNVSIATLANSNVSGNSASDDGGGIATIALGGQDSTINLESTIIAGNTATTNADISNDMGGTINANFSLIQTGDASLITSGSNNLFGGDPRLDPDGLKDNGGPTRTIALLSDSPAIDAGRNLDNLLTDQRGANRTVGGGTDIGAFERQNESPIAVDDTLTTSEDTILTGSVLDDNGNGVDSDLNEDELTIAEINGSSIDVGNPITLTSGALVTLNGDGEFAINPKGQFEPLAVSESITDSFIYTLSDGIETSMATVNLTINGVNDAPTVAAPISAIASEDDAAFSLNLLTGVTDIENDTLTIENLTLASGDDTGVTITGNRLDIDPAAYNALAAGEEAVINYSYDIIDGNGGRVSQTVALTITGANDDPVFEAIQGPNFGVTGQTLTFNGRATDPKPNDNLTFRWSILDGTTEIASGTDSSFDFTPTTINDLAVELTVTDAQGTINTTTSSLTISHFLLEDSTLYVGGTNSRDSIKVTKKWNEEVRASLHSRDNHLDLEETFTSPIDQVVVFGLDGNDSINIKTKKDTTIEAQIFGGDDHDYLNGDDSNDRLMGGQGYDVLKGKDGADILIGVDSRSVLPGVGEIDGYKGGKDADLFVLGDANQVYYDDGSAHSKGFRDFAYLEDFKPNQGDKIQLHGEAGDYSVYRFRGRGIGGSRDTAIVLNEDTPELIAIVRGNRFNQSLDLTDTTTFQYV